ncbi:Sjogren's syndrome/scleroderma autoantigen 1 family protein [Haloarchaeobius iranensis]|uniref:Sjogren's syndrome/scleroderma autoantigen 1 (Autoantigen p27) n=1 Tax=Haloarchaeobius iranensis TaxID=996166 RepID=A0A1G9SNH0_9EURY|nr:Sjogren's syndrome/scleroderma autoantigen 1 family protein [Haloarchaeobius iranensis]SDM36944.1 Sjogren's syndrome/scleroderma autoantigen 1 (Autoantigen p27) [Haloarchaeobius iranensis]
MSEEFDKEAEREKLREQFATEEEEREQTRRMSELLLKGATMTNRHCDRCGDPVFRQNGQEFCPSCQGGGQAAAQQQQQQRQQQQQQSTSDSETEPAPELDEASDPGTEPAPEPATEGPARTRTTTPTGTAETPDRTPAPEPIERTPRVDDRTPTTPTDATEFDDAAAAIEATIRRFSAAAANTDDPARAREYLQTVREASDTLAALRGR